ncbi:MAG TPA: hypothetical protein VIX82_05695 [Solirubrobacteraceae bacterium]
MNRARRHTPALVLVGVVVVAGGFPCAAEAHGPIAPIASSYLAKVSRVPPRMEAKVVDGDLRMWLRVVPSEMVLVLDYRGAPYLRFSGSGVDVNQHSAMYYLNQTPVAETPPSNLSRTTPPRWQRVSGGYDYGWHDGRLHALATVALAPGATYVGRWVIPVVVDGHRSGISGGLWYAGAPSIVWFWPIVVMLVCVAAAWRVRRPQLDALVARVCAIVALVGIGVAAVARGLHGRPDVGVFQLVEMGLLLALLGWLFVRVLRIRRGYFRFFAIAFIALWEGIELIPTLRHGFVLLALPVFLTRAATVVCLGCGACLVALAASLAEQPEDEAPTLRVSRNARDGDDEDFIESLA